MRNICCFEYYIKVSGRISQNLLKTTKLETNSLVIWCQQLPVSSDWRPPSSLTPWKNMIWDQTLVVFSWIIFITLPGPSGGGLRDGLPGWWTPRSPSTKDNFKQELSLSLFSSSSPGIVSQQLLPRRWRRFSWYAPPSVCKIFRLTHICFGYSSSAQTWGKSWYQWTRQTRPGFSELRWRTAFAGSRSSRPQPFFKMTFVRS